MTKIAVVIMMALALMLPTATDAARGGGAVNMQYTSYQRTINNPVEQLTEWPFPEDEALNIINPSTACSWDIDDFTYSIAEGSVKAGQTITSPNECMIATQSPVYKTVNGNTGWWSQPGPWYGAQVVAPSADLVVNVCYQPANRCFAVSPVFDSTKSAWVYNSCSQAIYAPEDPLLVEISGSHGGLGVVNQVTTSINNPTGRNMRNVTSMVGVVGVINYIRGWGGCKQGTPQQSEYPYTWSN